MRNHLFLCAFLLICGGLNAQTQLLGSPTTLVKNRGAFMSDSLLYIPKRTKAPSDSGAIRYNIADSAVYVWTGYQWRAVSASTGVYVPYTGATADVDLGNFSLNAKSIHIKGTAGQGHLGLKHQSNTPSLSASESAIYANVNGDLAWHNDNLYSSIFKTSLTTASRTYTFQNKSYTVGDSADIALKVNISDTATMLSPYIRAAGYGLTKSSQSLLVDSATIATRARVQKGIDSLGAAKQNVLTNPVTGTGTTNYLAKFTGTSAVGNSQIFDDGASIGIGTATPTYKFDIRGTGSMVHSIKSNSGSGQGATYNILQSGGVSSLLLIGDKSGQVGGTPDQSAALRAGTNIPIIFEPNAAEAMRLNTAGEMIVSSDGTDAGAYKFQVQGNIYNTTGAVFAASSGNVGIGTASPTAKLQVDGAITATSGPYPSAVNGIHMHFTDNIGYIQAEQGGTSYRQLSLHGSFINFVTQGNERMRIKSDGEVLIGTTSDAGAYSLQNSGAFYNTGSAILAATSGSVGIGTTLTTGKLNFENTTAVVTDGIIFTASNGAGTNHGFRIGINRQARAEVASSIKFLAENYSINDNTYITFGTGFNDAERMRITSTGRILAGTTSSISGGLNEQRIQSYGTDDLAGFSALRVSANTGGSRFVLAKSRGATYTIVNDGDGLGIISFQGADGSTLYRSAEISGQVDGTPSAGSVPGRLVFETNMSERMRIKSDGEVLIATTTDAGAYALQVSGAIYNTTTITTGAPTSGTAKPWRLGEAATVSPTSPNRTIRVEIDGTVYYIHAKTTND